MRITKRLQTLLKNRNFRNVSILVGGTAFSQLISILALPLLTRIYSPEDFTVLATFSSILTILTVISCSRLEIAIPIPSEKEEAIQLLALSILSVVTITLFTFMVISFFPNVINQLTKNRIADYLWLLPLGLLFGGAYNALQYWMVREKVFSLVSKTKITQSLSGTITQLGMGYAAISPLGLLLGQILNSGAGIFGLLIFFIKKHKTLILKINPTKLKNTLKRYQRFPKYSTLEALTNSAGTQLPILIIATITLNAEAGFLMLAIRLLSAPMSLIGNSIAQVYLAEAAQKYHKGELKNFTIKTTITLGKIGIIPLFLSFITAPTIIPFLFGEEWQRTGILISWMTPWFFIQFITSPVSMSLHISNNQHIAMVLQVIGLIFRCSVVFIMVNYFSEWVGEAYAISGFIFYSLYLSVIFIVINKETSAPEL